MTAEQLEVMRDLALKAGRSISRKFFQKRGNHSEAHLSEIELTSIATVAFELGFQAAGETI